MLSSMQVRVLLKLVKPHISNYSEAGPITPEEPCSFPLTQPTVGMLVDVPRCKKSVTLIKSPCTCVSLAYRTRMYDSVDREIWVVLDRFGAPEKVISVIRQSDEVMRARVHRGDNQNSG